MRTEKQTLQIAWNRGPSLPKVELETEAFTQVVYFEQWSQDEEVKYLEKRKWKEIIAYSRCIFKLFTQSSYDSISVWAMFEKWYTIYPRIVHLRRRRIEMYASAPMWSKVILVINSNLLQVCTCVGMAEQFRSVSRGRCGSPFPKLWWGVVRLPLYTASCRSINWNKKGWRRMGEGSYDTVIFTFFLLINLSGLNWFFKLLKGKVETGFFFFLLLQYLS